MIGGDFNFEVGLFTQSINGAAREPVGKGVVREKPKTATSRARPGKKGALLPGQTTLIPRSSSESCADRKVREIGVHVSVSAGSDARQKLKSSSGCLVSTPSRLAERNSKQHLVKASSDPL